MKYINIPKDTESTIDLGAITNNCKGIIIAYKGDKAVGRISYCSDTDLWYFYNSIDDSAYEIDECTLFELINELVDTKHIADNFRLLEFYSNDNDQQTRHLTGSFT